jgi:hypothetical protein
MDRERAEAHLRLLVEEELRRATAQASDGTAGSPTEGEPVRSASVTGTLAGGAAVPDAVMASRGGQSADRVVTELYSVHYQALVRLAALLVRDARTAEQVVQDSLAAMHDGGHQLRDVGTALAYLRQTVVNRSRSVMHRRAFPGAVHRARAATVALVLTAGPRSMARSPIRSWRTSSWPWPPGSFSPAGPARAADRGRGHLSRPGRGPGLAGSSGSGR